MWYRSPGSVGNRRWTLGAARGDVRGSHGFTVLWDLEQLVRGLDAAFEEAEPPRLDRLPSPTQTGDGVQAVRGAPQGARNEILNRVAFKAARDGRFDEGELTEAALDAGLPAREVAATLESAERAGRAAGGPKLGEIEVAAALAGAGIGESHAHTPGVGLVSQGRAVAPRRRLQRDPRAGPQRAA